MTTNAAKEHVTWIDREQNPVEWAAVAENGFNAPVPYMDRHDGYWVYTWSLEQYRQGLPFTDGCEQ